MLRRRPPPPAPAPPRLELSGPRLARALSTVVERSETLGGIESHVTALSFKSRLFATALGADRIDALDEDVFTGLCALIAPVRRRLGHHLAQTGFAPVRDAVRTLLDGAHDTTTTDARLDAFQRRFPAGRSHRWTRDLGAELLHFSDPERYPLMTRWIWDRAANTGVLREIWHAADLDHLTLDVPDRFETFLVLREELAGFLSDNGIFRDTLLYVDLLCAQVYSEYIAAQGGSFLRTDFAAAVDPMAFTRRMLGLDGIDPETGRTRFKRGDGAPHVVDQQSLPI